MPIPPYDPTPEEIKAVCEQIRKEWSDDDHWLRRSSREGKSAPFIARRYRIRGVRIYQPDPTSWEW